MTNSNQLMPNESTHQQNNTPIQIEQNNSESIHAAFERFLAAPENNRALANNREHIIKQALCNLGFDKKTSLSSTELKLFENELNQVIYLNSQLPSFIISESKEENISDEFENPETALDADEKYARNARNLLRHLTRGTPLCKTDGEPYSNSPLAKDEIIKTLLSKRDPRLLDAFRVEMQKIFNNAFEKLQLGQLTPNDEKQYEIFQSTFLTAYPFMDPLVDETVNLPQKINGLWIKVAYQFKRLDISPKSGPLSWVIEEQDRMYAYVLVSEEKEVFSHLLLMGTTYPAGQGAGLAVTYNFYPRHSVGEAHNMTEVDAWLEQQKQSNKKVKVMGHSKGATMAMITAARHPDKITQADCLNSTGLCGDTLDRLTPAWNRLRHDQQPCINVYAQLGDPAFPLEKGFLEGTNIYRVIPNTDKSAMNCSTSVPIPEFARKAYEAHIHHLAGRNSALLLKVNPKFENTSKRREFFNDIKYALNWLRFPVEYLELFIGILARKAERFYNNHKKLIIGGLSLTALAVCGVLAYTGVLVPIVALLAKPVLAKLGVSLTTNLAYGITAGFSVGASLLTPPLLKLASKVVTFAAKVTNVSASIAAHITAISLGSLYSGLKMGIKSLGHAIFTSSVKPPQAELAETDLSNEKTPATRRLQSSSALTLSSIQDANLNQEPEEKSELSPVRISSSHIVRSNSLPNLTSLFHNKTNTNPAPVQPLGQLRLV